MSTTTENGLTEPPPEVDATLSRLTANKNVRGVLILSRPTGVIIRAAGPLFATPAVAPTASADGTTTPSTSAASPAAVFSEPARAYAKAAVRLVDNVGEEVGKAEEGDDVRFLRIRTRKHELLITPDSSYILIVVQDPAN